MATHEDIVEQTLQDLLQAVRDLNPGGSSASPSASSTKTTESAFKKFSETVGKTTGVVGSAASTLTGAVGTTAKTLTGAATKTASTLTGAATKTASSLTTFSKALDTKAVKLFEAGLSTSTAQLTSFTNIFGNLPVFGSSIQSLGKITQENIDVFRDLASVGADFGKGITEFRTSAAEAGLSVDDFRKVVTQNSETFAMFAGSVATGTQRFVEISKVIQKQYTPVFSKLGMTMGELSDYTAGYIEQQTRFGKSQSMTMPQLIEGTQQYILELDQLSRVTGLSRKQIADQQKQAMQDARVKTLMSTLDKTARDEVRKSLTLISTLPDNYRDAIKELIATGGIPISNMAKDIAATQPLVYKAAVGLSKGAGSAEDIARSIRESSEHAERRFDREGSQTANVIATMGDGLGYAADQAILGAKNLGLGLDKARLEQEEATERSNTAILAIDKAFTDLKSKVMLGLTPILEKFGMTVSKLVTKGMPYFDKFFNKLSEIYDKISPKLNQMFERFGKMLSDSVPTIESWFDKFMDMLGKTVPGIINSLLDFGTNLPGHVKSIVDSLQKFMSDLADRTPNITHWLTEMLDGLSDKIPKIITWFKGLADDLEKQAPLLRQNILDLAASFDRNVPTIRMWIDEIPKKLEKFSEEILPKIISGFSILVDSVRATYLFFNDENFRKQVLFSWIDTFSGLIQQLTPHVLAGFERVTSAMKDYWEFTVIPLLQDAFYSLKNTLISYAALKWEELWDRVGESFGEAWLNFKKEYFSMLVTEDDLKEVTDRKERNKQLRTLHQKQLDADLEAADAKRKRERDADLQREKENKTRKTHVENQEAFDNRVKEINKSIADSLQTLKDTLGSVMPGSAPNAGMPAEMPLGAGDVAAPEGAVSTKGINTKNAAIAMKFLQNKGWTKEQSASIVGNLMGESGMSTTALDYIQRGRVKKGLGIQESKAHYGIAQWDKTRRDRFEKMFGMRVEHAPLEKQLEYLDWELRNTESRVGRNLGMTRTIEGGTPLFMREFERPSAHEQAKSIGTRLKFARQAYGLGDPGSIPSSGAPSTPTGPAPAGTGTAAYLSSMQQLGGPNNFSIAKRAVLKGVDPRLVSIMREASKYSKYKVELFSGKAGRPGKKSSHPIGKAVDIGLIDPATGGMMPNSGKLLRQSSREQAIKAIQAHQEFANIARMVQMQMYPELNEWFRSGAYFGGSPGEAKGAKQPWDLMHFDISPYAHGAMGGGSWEGGFKQSQLAYFLGLVNKGLGGAGTLGSTMYAGGKTPRGRSILAAAKTQGGESTNISPTAAMPVSGGAGGGTTGISDMSMALLTATNNKLDQINTNMEKLVHLTDMSRQVHEKVLSATKKQKNTLLTTTV